MPLKHQSTLLRPFIKAGQIIPLRVAGRFVQLVSALSSMEIKAGDSPASLFRPGSGVEFAPPDEFELVEVKNVTGVDQFIEIWIGYAKYNETRQAFMEPETEFVPWTGTQIAATSGQVFAAALTGTRMRRKSIQVTNGDATLRLQLRDAAGNVGLEIFPETSVTLPISGYVQVYNPNGAPVSCSVSEIYWVG